MKRFKELSKGRKITILVAIIAIILGVALFAKWEMDKQQLEKEISEQLIAVEQWNGKINDEKDDAKKLEMLKSLIKEYDEYKKGDNHAEVNSKYEAIIKDVKSVFVKKYNKTLSDSTLKNVDKIDDKSTLNKANKSLKDLLKTVNGDEGKITLSESQIKDYGDKINDLINKYDKRVKAIEKKEKEQKEKEEAERKAKEEAEAKAAEEQQKQLEQQQNNAVNSGNNGGNSYQQPSNGGGSGNSSNSNSGNSSSNNNSNSNNGGKVDISRLEHHWDVDLDTGEKVPGSDVWFDRATGNNYDANGNFLFNDDF